MAELPRTNKEIRKWYHDLLSQIPKLNNRWIKDGMSPKARARRAWRFRYNARLAARRMMQDKKEIELLEKRDLALYGTPDGPTFEYLVNRLKLEGLKGDAIYEAIIKGSYRTNTGIDKMLGF